MTEKQKREKRDEFFWFVSLFCFGRLAPFFPPREGDSLIEREREREKEREIQLFFFFAFSFVFSRVVRVSRREI